MSNEGAQRYLLVDVANEPVGIGIDWVQEVIEQVQMTQVPMCESEVAGVINVRGSVVPVIDLAKRLGLHQKEYDKYSCVVLYELHDPDSHLISVIGLLVHRVHSIESFHPEQLAHSPEFGCHIEPRFIDSLVQYSGRLQTLLVMEQVLDVAEINQSMLSSQQGYFDALRRSYA